jgi:hypothetical protein
MKDGKKAYPPSKAFEKSLDPVISPNLHRVHILTLDSPEKTPTCFRWSDTSDDSDRRRQFQKK